MKKIIVAFIVVLLLGIGGTAFYQKKQEVVPQNETMVEATILSIVGNEIETVEGNDYTIPVGTQVITKLGNITTFARLSAGDNVQMIVEKDNKETILKMWIVE